jgi:ADP-ribose pyrophosphatase
MSAPGVRGCSSFRLLEEEVKFKGRMVTVSVERVVLPNGHEMRQERIHLPAAVAVVPLLEERRGRPDVILVEQFRASVRGYIHEIPAGILEEGEEPAGCARRELEEETGYVAGRLLHFATLCPIPGTSAHRMHYFLAEDLAPGKQKLDEAECLAVKRFPFAEVLAAILAGPPAAGAAGGGESEQRLVVIDSKTHLGILHAGMLKRRGAAG